MDLSKKLTKLGFTQKQALVYLACLQLGVGTVMQIAQFSGLKRPSVYLILDELEEKGLVSRVKEARKIMYKAEEPQRLLTDLHFKREMTENLMPSLETIYSLDPAKLNVKVGAGMQGVRNAYNGIFTFLAGHPQEELLIFGSLKDAAANFEREVQDQFFQLMGKAKNPVREIGNDDHETRAYYRVSAKINPRHDIRLIRNEGRFFQTDNMLYGNTLVIFSVKEHVWAITVESVNISETYRTIFNMAWRSGKPI